jgi:MFS family permease
VSGNKVQPVTGPGRHHTAEPAAPGKPGLGREYRKLWTASTASAIGDGMSLTAAPLLASSLTNDPRLIAGVTMALTLPYVLFGIPAGVLVDRLDLRRSMAFIDWFRGVALAALTVSAAVGWGSLPVLYLCFFLVGTGETFFRNASQIMVPSVVRPEVLVTANSRLMAAQTAGNQFVGPLLGAALFTVGAVLPFGVDSLTFFVSATLLTTLRVPASEPPSEVSGPDAGKRPSLLADMATGARWLWRHRLLRSLAAVAAVINLVQTGTLAVLVVHTDKVLGLGDTAYGLLLACQAAGAVFAAKVSPWLTGKLGSERSLVWVALTFAAGNTAIWLLPSAWAVGAALALAACAGVTWDVVVVVLRQTLIPKNLQGRVNSVYRLVAWGAMPVGAGLAGLLTDAAGTPAVFGAGAAVMAAVTARLVFGARNHWFGDAGVEGKA